MEGRGKRFLTFFNLSTATTRWGRLRWRIVTDPRSLRELHGWTGIRTQSLGITMPLYTLFSPQFLESVAAFLPCNLGPAPASNCVNLTWNGPSGETLLNLDVMCHHSGASLDMAWGLRMHNTSQQEGIWFTCSWRDLSEGTSVLRNGRCLWAWGVIVKSAVKVTGKSWRKIEVEMYIYVWSLFNFF